MHGFHIDDDRTKTLTWLVEAVDNIGAQFAYEGDGDSELLAGELLHRV